MHEAIDRLHQRGAAARAARARPRTAGPTSIGPPSVDLAEEVVAELESAGRTGRAASWANERATMLDELDRVAAQTTPVGAAGRSIRCSEASFGDDGDGRGPRPLPDGRTIRLPRHGRPHRRAARRQLVVIDHKTGKADQYRAVGAGRSDARRHPVPAAGVRRCRPGARRASPARVVRAEYAFFGKGSFQRIGVTFDDAAWEVVRGELAEVVDGIDAGFFPAQPAAAGMAAVRGLRLLRARRPRHGRAVVAVGAQAPRPPPGPRGSPTPEARRDSELS